MKNKYQRMNKEEQKKLQEKYIKTEKGKMMSERLKRLNIYGIIGIILSITLFYIAIINKTPIYDYVIAITLFIASNTFIIASYLIKGKELNKFALKRQQ